MYPKVSVRAEPHVALVDANVDKKGTRAAAEAYLEFLYTEPAQELIAETFFRPENADVAKRNASKLEPIELFRATDPTWGLGDWNKIQKDFFSEGGVFDQIYQSGR